MPVVNSSPGEHKKHKILMKSPWEILQTPVGSGGVISLLSSHNILESLAAMGVEYIEVTHISHAKISCLETKPSCFSSLSHFSFVMIDYLIPII